MTASPGELHMGFGTVTGDRNSSPVSDLAEAASHLFAALHDADASGKPRIAVAPVPDEGTGIALNDRLRRAATPE